MAYHIFHSDQPLTLESGYVVPHYHLAYTTWGQLNKEKDNVIWVFHALTANSDPAEWWPGLIGAGKYFDPAQYFIICVNMPGSCYGSIGPLEKNEATGKIFYHDFPLFTIRDMVHAYRPLQEHLGIQKVKIGIGGSMGGQQLLEYAIEQPELFEYIFLIATNAKHSPWGIAFNSSQRMCIESDSTWKENNEHAGMEGMKAARSIALISYRHYETYHHTQSETDTEKKELFKSESYQRYQGEKLAKRFNAFSYYYLSQAMDSHNVGRKRGGLAKALQQVKARTTAIGIATDILFPPGEQQFLASHIPGAQFRMMESLYGHDGFLLEYTQLQKIISESLSEETWS